MFLTDPVIDKKSLVRNIVSEDYRCASVFEKYGISYCCGGNYSLETACLMQGIPVDELVKELERATRNVLMSSSVQYDQWSIDFLIDYIINVHHHYLRVTVPEMEGMVKKFIAEHDKKYPQLSQLATYFDILKTELLPLLTEEENIVFAYIRQLAHAYESNDSYAHLLVKTLRKPYEKMIGKESESVSRVLKGFRAITDNYKPPEKACTSHGVVFAKLHELDKDLIQHIFLENNVLFPRIATMEKELLRLKSEL